MRFPEIGDVATTDVIKISIKKTLNSAIDTMYKSTHRNIIVYDDKNQFFILTASDILQLKLKKIDFSKLLSELNLKKMATINKEENILDTIAFLENDIEYFCAINSDGSLYGILTHTDIISNIDPETLMENYRISDLININKHIHKTSANIKASEVLGNMVGHHYDCVVVIENQKPIGIVTTKDIVNILKNKSSLDEPISKYMSHPIESLNENSSIKEAISFMKEKSFKRIVITNESGNLTGLIQQKELISLSYSRWAVLMKEYSTELSEINNLLEKKNQKYEKLATTDTLTGLYNRYKFTELYVSEYQTMAKRDNKMSLFIMDIDYFKNINDTYGHNIGDKILQQVSHILLKYLRNVDIVGRWGGEEFVAILPTASLENSLILVEKIRAGIEEYVMVEDIKLTASFGISEVKIGDELTDVVKRADDALYEAKNSGRNCIKYK